LGHCSHEFLSVDVGSQWRRQRLSSAPSSGLRESWPVIPRVEVDDHRSSDLRAGGSVSLRFHFLRWGHSLRSALLFSSVVSPFFSSPLCPSIFLLPWSRTPAQWRRSPISPLRFCVVASVPVVRSRGSTSQRVQFVNSSFDLCEDFQCESL
jgi:hypothetical protein